MRYIKIGSDVKLYFQAKNNAGGVVDITSAEITVSFKTSFSTSSYLARKRNTAAGGGDTQVKATSASDGLFIAFFDRDDVANLQTGYNFIEVYIKVSEDEYILQDVAYVRDVSSSAGSSIAYADSPESDYGYVRFSISSTGDPPTFTEEVKNASISGTLTVEYTDSQIVITSTASDFTVGKTVINTTFSAFTPDGWTDTAKIIKLQPYDEFQPGTIQIYVYE